MALLVQVRAGIYPNQWFSNWGRWMNWGKYGAPLMLEEYGLLKEKQDCLYYHVELYFTKIQPTELISVD